MKQDDFYNDHGNFQILLSLGSFPSLSVGDGSAFKKLNLNGYYNIRVESITGINRATGVTYPAFITHPLIFESSICSPPVQVIPGGGKLTMVATYQTNGADLIQQPDFELDYQYNGVYINGGITFRLGVGTQSQPFNFASSLWQPSQYLPSYPAWNENGCAIIQISYRKAKDVY